MICLLDIFYKPNQKGKVSSGQYDFYIKISAGCAKFISVYAQPPFFENYLIHWKSKHTTSLRGYKTSTDIIFHATLVQIANFGKICAVVNV